jgi:hypothetical protein
MSPRNRTWALLLVLVHFLIVNLIATFVPFPNIPLGFRNLTLFFSSVLVLDIALVVNQLRRNKWDE